jgi:hypothetical protein
MISYKATTDLNNFWALRRWMGIELSKDMIKKQLNAAPASSTNLVLRFELPTSLGFGNLRINITMLLRLLPDFKGYFAITTTERSARVPWRDLQRTVFLLLSDILEQRPSRQDQPLPKIWIDGHGAILRATYLAATTGALDEGFIS